MLKTYVFACWQISAPTHRTPSRMSRRRCRRPSRHPSIRQVVKWFDHPSISLIVCCFQWALADARDTIDKTKKKKSVLPVDRMHTLLQKVSFKQIDFEGGHPLNAFVSLVGGAAIQNRQFRESVSGRSARVHFGRHPKAGGQLRQEHETRRNNPGRCTNCHSRGQCKLICRELSRARLTNIQTQ